jgi:hypothetical protein
MKKIALSFILCLLTVSCGLHGATTYEILTDIGTSPRMIGMGNMEGFDDSAVSIFENPAALDRINRTSLSGFYTAINDGAVNLYSYAVAYRLPVGVLGFGMMQTSIPSIHQTAADNNDKFFSVRTFTYSNSLYKLGYGLELNKYTRLGAGLNYVTQSILEVSGSGYNGDLGVIFGNGDAEVSLSAKHFLGIKVNYDGGAKEKPPTQYVLSTKLPFLTRGMHLYNQYKALTTKNRGLYSCGLRYVPPQLDDMFGISVGWQEVVVIREKQNKWTLGMTLDLGAVDLGFAYEQANYVGQNGQYYFSVNYDL